MEYTTGTIVFDNWKITEKLGEGASGQVFKIVKEMDDIILKSALKVIRIPQSQDEVHHILNEGMTQDSVSIYFMQIVEDIKKEVKAMIQLKDHPNIVRCDDFVFIPAANQVGGDILIRMELLTPLNNYVTQGSVPEVTIMQMARDLCSALDFCHKKGMVHRDIKPENIFVNAMGQFKLGDFGLARTAEKSTGGLSKKGTEGYMAPEVYLGKRYNHTVDIYSLGLVLYKSLNHNRLPFFPTSGVFSYADREEALSRRMSGDAMPRPVDASAAFGEVILKACAFDPAQRYQSAAEMLNAIGGQKVQSADWNTSVKTHTKNTNEDKVQYNKEKESVVTKKEEKQKGKKKGKAPIIIAIVSICLIVLGTYSAYNHSGEHKVERYKKAAEAGDSEAMKELGYMYQNGFAVRQNYEEAVKWYKKATEAGNTEAMKKLAFMYQKGYGVEQDNEKATEWYQKAKVKSNEG